VKKRKVKYCSNKRLALPVSQEGQAYVPALMIIFLS
jgi:hypothetical protein